MSDEQLSCAIDLYKSLIRGISFEACVIFFSSYLNCAPLSMENGKDTLNQLQVNRCRIFYTNGKVEVTDE